MKVHTSVDYEIYDSTGDASIGVKPCDFMVRIKTYDDDSSKEWFGDVDFSLNLECAEAVAKAMLRVVEDLKKDEAK